MGFHIWRRFSEVQWGFTPVSTLSGVPPPARGEKLRQLRVIVRFIVSPLGALWEPSEQLDSAAPVHWSRP